MKKETEAAVYMMTVSCEVRDGGSCAGSRVMSEVIVSVMYVS